MDAFYFKKYSQYLRYGQHHELFLTLKNLKRGCAVDVNPHYEKSLNRILEYYKMNYVIERFEIPKYDKTILHYYITKKSISEEEKNLFLTSTYSGEKSIALGTFLGYPYPMDMREVNDEKDGWVRYTLILNNKRKHFMIYRVPKSKVNSRFLKSCKDTLRKYKTCMKQIYPNCDIELTISI